MAVLPRFVVPGDVNGTRGYNRWWDWGRWVAFAVIVGVAIMVFFLFSCYNARRRRRRGVRPITGTGWMAPPPGPPPPQAYYADQIYPQYQQPPPPSYSPPNPQHYGYFGSQRQQTGIELQQPPHSYQQAPGDRVFEPPPGPPPGKS